MRFSPNGSLKTLVFVYRCCGNLNGITPARQFSTCTLVQELWLYSFFCPRKL